MENISAPRVTMSQLLKDRPHNKQLIADLINHINKYNESNFKKDQDSFVRLTASLLDGGMLAIVYASDDYIYDIVNGVKSALLKLELILLEEQQGDNGRYFLKWKQKLKHTL